MIIQFELLKLTLFRRISPPFFLKYKVALQMKRKFVFQKLFMNT